MESCEMHKWEKEATHKTADRSFKKSEYEGGCWPCGPSGARSVPSIQISIPYIDSLSYCSNDSVSYTEGLTMECTCLVPRPFPPPVLPYDCLQYANTFYVQAIEYWRWQQPGNESRSVLCVTDCTYWSKEGTWHASELEWDDTLWKLCALHKMCPDRYDSCRCLNMSRGFCEGHWFGVHVIQNLASHAYNSQFTTAPHSWARGSIVVLSEILL